MYFFAGQVVFWQAYFKYLSHTDSNCCCHLSKKIAMEWLSALSDNAFYEFAAILFFATLLGAIGQLLKQPLIVTFIALGVGYRLREAFPRFSKIFWAIGQHHQHIVCCQIS